MEPGGVILHSQGLSNIPYPEPNHPKYPVIIPISGNRVVYFSAGFRKSVEQVRQPRDK